MVEKLKNALILKKKEAIFDFVSKILQDCDMF